MKRVKYPTPPEGFCACGKKLSEHKSYQDPKVKKRFTELFEKVGEYIEVKSKVTTYRVPRWYIALHGIDIETIDELGFNSVNNS